MLSRIISIPDNISVKIINFSCIFKSKNGEIIHHLNENLKISIIDENLSIESNSKTKNKKINTLAIINTTHVLFKNYIHGLLFLFEKNLILNGIGYKAEYKNNILKLFIGYSHPVIYKIPNDIKLELITNTNISIKGVSKHKVGQIAHEIKMKKPPEIYKGIGIKYKDEIIKLKSPKKAK